MDYESSMNYDGGPLVADSLIDYLSEKLRLPSNNYLKKENEYLSHRLMQHQDPGGLYSTLPRQMQLSDTYLTLQSIQYGSSKPKDDPPASMIAYANK